MRTITIYSPYEKIDMNKLRYTLRFHNVKNCEDFDIEFYHNEMKTLTDIKDFIDKFYTSEIFVIGNYEYGSGYSDGHMLCNAICVMANKYKCLYKIDFSEDSYKIFY